MLKHYLTIAFRNMWKYKTQSIISIIGLTVSFICFAYCTYQLRMQDAFNRDLKDVDRICFIYNEGEGENEAGRNYNRTIPELLEKEYPEIESSIAIFDLMPYIGKLCEITGEDGNTQYFEEMFVMGNGQFMDFFDIQFIAGSITELDKYPGAILVTKKTALKFFGTTDVVGKTFTDINDFYDQKETYTIRGVIKDFPDRTYFSQFCGMEWNSPLVNDPGFRFYNEPYFTYIKLKPGTDIDKLNQKLKNHPVRYAETNGETAETSVQLMPLLQYYDFMSKSHPSSKAFIFFMIGCLVLLTAFLNYIIFIFGRVLNRIKECGIRKVNGSSRLHLFMLFFVEALVVYLIACLLCFPVVSLSFPFFNNMTEYRELDTGYFYTLLVQYTLAGIVFIGLLSLAITWRLIRIPVLQSIGQGLVLRQNSHARSIFLTVQLAICFLFVGASWFVDRQNKQMESAMTAGLNKDDRSRIFSVGMNGDKLDAARPDMLRKLQQNPNIEIVSRNGMDLFGAWQIGEGRFTWDSITEIESKTTMNHICTDANFAELVKITPKEGRFFKPNDNTEMVVNESFAKLVNRNPIGMNIGVNYWGEGMQYYRVVGVIPDIANNQYKSNLVYPCFYYPYPEGYINLTCYIKVKPGYGKTFQVEMETELRKYLSPGTNIWISNLKERTSQSLSEEVDLLKMVSTFSLICIIITLLGMYASVVLTTEKRKKEIAIRKINGATQGIIIRMFCKDIYVSLFISACIAFPILIYGLNNWLKDYAVRIPIGILPFVLLFMLLALIVTLITIGQIVRIAHTNPAEVIKSE
jgi:ABC-type antimicrobial peptide transport system permease subunit